MPEFRGSMKEGWKRNFRNIVPDEVKVWWTFLFCQAISWCDKFYRKHNPGLECGYNVKDFCDDQGLVRIQTGPVIFCR